MTVAIIDELWTEFRLKCEMRGWFPAATVWDWSQAYLSWRVLDAEQKHKALECVKGHERPFLVGESLPANFLRDRKFLRPAPRNGRTVQPVSAVERERQTEQVIDALAEDLKREQYKDWCRGQLKAWVLANVDTALYEAEVQAQARRVRSTYRTLLTDEVARLAETWAQARWQDDAEIKSYEEWKQSGV